MSKLTKIPVLIKLNPNAVYSADLEAATKIDKHNLDRQLREQPGVYAWWMALLTEVEGKVEFLEDQLGVIESNIFKEFKKKGFKQYDIKYRVRQHPKYLALKKKIRRWRKTEALLKHAEKALAQREHCLLTLSVNRRKERDQA